MFDFVIFRRMVSPWLVPVAYWLAVAMYTDSIWGSLPATGTDDGLRNLIMSRGAQWLGIVLALRLICEFFLVQFEILDALRAQEPQSAAPTTDAGVTNATHRATPAAPTPDLKVWLAK